MSNKKLNDTYLISEELLKLHSPISKNVDVDKLIPFLTISQPYYVESILGEALTTELKTQIETDSLTEENKALILKIAPALANWTAYLALRSLAYTITEKSITKEHSENSEALSERELGEMILYVKNLAEMATELLIKYLCLCSLTYPLWRANEDCNCEKYLPTDGKAKQDKKFVIFFPDKAKKKGCDKCDRDVFIKKY